MNTEDLVIGEFYKLEFKKGSNDVYSKYDNVVVQYVEKFDYYDTNYVSGRNHSHICDFKIIMGYVQFKYIGRREVGSSFTLKSYEIENYFNLIKL